MDFDPQAAAEICERLSNGESLRKICGEERADNLPGQTTVYQWLAANADFAKQYAHARETQGETYADRAVDEALTASDAAIGRLRMDALKWAASKLAPKKYGDKVALTGGSDDDAPLQFQNVSNRDRAKAVAALVARSRKPE